jgi:hypothetical protein
MSRGCGAIKVKQGLVINIEVKVKREKSAQDRFESTSMYL